MKIVNNLISTKSGILPQSLQKEELSKDQCRSCKLINSQVSLAIKSYAAPQLNFGMSEADRTFQVIMLGSAQKEFNQLTEEQQSALNKDYETIKRKVLDMFLQNQYVI